MRKAGIAALAAAMLGTSPAMAINTFPAWNGTDAYAAFGCGQSTVFGQTIVIPKWKSSIGSFTFWMANYYSGSKPIIIRGEIYQWDPVNGHATGSAVWESAPRKINFKDDNFHHVSFKADVAVTAGAQYVLFATVDKDYDKCTDRTLTFGANIGGGPYSKGQIFGLNDGGDTSQWTTKRWWNIGTDWVFKATMPPLN
ncbi:MAG TPA: hypothetical protein VMF58_15820 [Rhizomicrobium sp.]|nr:hypothetical protein [Rhizomicrobium sp.]